MQPYDLPLEELKKYRPALTRREDFAEFWESTKAQLAQEPFTYELTPLTYPADGVRLYQLNYRGFHGARIQGYFAAPDKPGTHPGLVLYHGYDWSFDGGIHDVVNWALHGYATFGMLVRGQHSSEDNTPSPNGNTVGWMTKGILQKETYYYRGVYMDAIRALDVMASLEQVDQDRIGVTGGSQGGALALVAAALSDVPKAAVSEYPYLSNFRRAIDISPAGPYLEFSNYFRRNSDPAIEEKAMETLSYYDVMNLADRINCPVLVSIGLIDQITPPSTVFAAYNHIGSEQKEIKVYRYFGHEFMPAFHTEKLAFLHGQLKK